VREVQFGVDGPECGDYEIIYTNGLLDQVNEGRLEISVKNAVSESHAGPHFPLFPWSVCGELLYAWIAPTCGAKNRSV
jgi:hypothetical protein